MLILQYTIKGVSNMEYEIVNVAEKQVDGIMIHTENTGGKAMRDIYTLWNDFLESGKAELIKGRVGENYIGLYTDYEGDFSAPYAYIAGCETDGKHDPAFTARKIFAGRYAKFGAKGDLKMCIRDRFKTKD